MRIKLSAQHLGALAVAASLVITAACSGPSSSITGPTASAAVAASATFSPNPAPCPDPLNPDCEPPPPPPPPPGDQGCTPGYWKANVKKGAGNWTSPYAPGSPVSLAFVAGSFNSSTLLQALEFGGGTGVSGATEILLRAAVAAVLNAASSGVAYPLSVASIQSQVNAAIASGNRATILALATTLDNNNNLGCPLDNSGR